MLKTDFPFSKKYWPQRVLVFLLGEPFLGFLAIVAVVLTAMPMLFDVRPATNALVEIGQWVIIGFFALEFGVALWFAPSRRAFLLNPWRLIDFATIAIPLITLLPGVSNVLRSSPVLRLVRLVRVVTLGMRVGGVVIRDDTRRVAEQRTGPVEISRFSGEAQPAVSGKPTWDDFLSWVRAPGPQWYNVSSLGREDAQKIALAAGIPLTFFESHLLMASYPHIEASARYVAMFVWLPELVFGAQTTRNGLLLLSSGSSLLTLSKQPTRLMELVDADAPDAHLAEQPFAVRTTCRILQAVVKRNEQLVGDLENELRALEDLPVRESRQEFFEKTFHLKKELSAAQSDLWRLKGILSELADGRTSFPGSGPEAVEFFRALSNDAEYLYETVVNIREGVLSLIELHLNVVSFDMNRVMRVLAVVSVLGLIPGVVGGLFGMNLADNPWPFTLPQVAFAVVFAMVLCLYLFFVKGWLR